MPQLGVFGKFLGMFGVLRANSVTNQGRGDDGYSRGHWYWAVDWPFVGLRFSPEGDVVVAGADGIAPCLARNASCLTAHEVVLAYE